MSLLSNLVSGAVGAAVASAAKDYIAQQGGLQNVVAQFQQHGLGDIAQSWVGTGSNLPISAEQLTKVLGGAGAGSLITQFASKLGIPAETLSAQLAEHLPQVVDKMTPNGVVEAQAAA